MTSSWAALQLQLRTSCSVQPRHPVRVENRHPGEEGGKGGVGAAAGLARCFTRVSVAAEGGQGPEVRGTPTAASVSPLLQEKESGTLF